MIEISSINTNIIKSIGKLLSTTLQFTRLTLIFSILPPTIALLCYITFLQGATESVIAWVPLTMLITITTLIGVKLYEVSSALSFAKKLTNPEAVIEKANKALSTLSDEKKQLTTQFNELKDLESTDSLSIKKIKNVFKSLLSKKDILIELKESVGEHSEIIDNTLSLIEHSTGRSAIHAVTLSITTLIPTIWILTTTF
jgi:hypothetical protein